MLTDRPLTPGSRKEIKTASFYLFLEIVQKLRQFSRYERFLDTRRKTKTRRSGQRTRKDLDNSEAGAVVNPDHPDTPEQLPEVTKVRYQYSNHLGSASLELNDALCQIRFYPVCREYRLYEGLLTCPLRVDPLPGVVPLRFTF